MQGEINSLVRLRQSLVRVGRWLGIFLWGYIFYLSFCKEIANETMRLGIKCPMLLSLRVKYACWDDRLVITKVNATPSYKDTDPENIKKETWSIFNTNRLNITLEAKK